MPQAAVAVRLGSLRVNGFLGQCMIPYHISFQVLNFTLHNAYKPLAAVFFFHSNETLFLMTVKILLMKVLHSCVL